MFKTPLQTFLWFIFALLAGVGIYFVLKLFLVLGITFVLGLVTGAFGMSVFFVKVRFKNRYG